MPEIVPRKRAVTDKDYFYLYTDDITEGESPEPITLKKERYPIGDIKIDMQRLLPNIEDVAQFILAVRVVSTGETIFVASNVIGSPHYYNIFNEKEYSNIVDIYNNFTSI